MNFLALDISSANTGWALIEELGHGQTPRVDCGSFACRGRDFDENCMVLSDHLVALLRGFRERGLQVSRAAIEDVLRRLPTKRVKIDGGMFAATERDELVSNPHTMTVLPAMAGTASAILHQFKVPSILIPPSTWRKGFIGMGYAPRHVAKAKSRQWLKAEVRQKAELLGINLGFTVKNNDVSDALGLCFHLAATEGARAAIEALRRAA